MKPKALALFSGGLDSLLAVKLLQVQDVPVEAAHLSLPFTRSATPEGRAALLATAAQLPVKLHIIEPDEDLADMIAHPKFGHGKNFNPCQDCRIYQLRKAAALMPAIGASYLATGEVVGQRPMSQRRDAMSITDRESGLKGLILRPLSARCLPPTLPEERGWVDRGQLLGLAGRGRTAQESMARAWGLQYPSPGGGCLLTYRESAQRYRTLLDIFGELRLADIPLAGLGRHFRVGAAALVVVGRNQRENRALARHFHRDHQQRWLLHLGFVPGPLTLVLGEPSPADLEAAASLTARYADLEAEGPVLVKLLEPSVRLPKKTVLTATPAAPAQVEAWRVN